MEICSTEINLIPSKRLLLMLGNGKSWKQMLQLEEDSRSINKHSSYYANSMMPHLITDFISFFACITLSSTTANLLLKYIQWWSIYNLLGYRTLMFTIICVNKCFLISFPCFLSWNCTPNSRLFSWREWNDLPIFTPLAPLRNLCISIN